MSITVHLSKLTQGRRIITTMMIRRLPRCVMTMARSLVAEDLTVRRGDRFSKFVVSSFFLLLLE